MALPQPASGVKRKHTATDLETIELDSHYDLTLIVGTPDHKDGQKAFRVNKGSVRHVSDIWSKMLTGEWAEGKLAEIKFPDDSWRPFRIVLQVAHFQVAGLPDTLAFEELRELATLTDKYNLNKAMRMALELKQWLHKQKDQWTQWPSLPKTQHYATMTSIFQYDTDFSYITSKLAVEVEVDNLFLCHGRGLSRIQLATTLPDRVLCKSQTSSALPEHEERATNTLHAKITETRNRVLWGLIGCCKLAIANASKVDVKPPCGNARCAALKLGILVMGLTTAGLCPIPGDPKELHINIAKYWRANKGVGKDHQGYNPCDKVGKTYTSDRTALHGNSTGCSFASCFGDFGVVQASREVLQKALHADVYAHLQTATFMTEPV